MVNNKEFVTDVVSSMIDARSVDFHELQTEYEESILEIGNLIEVSFVRSPSHTENGYFSKEINGVDLFSELD